MYENLKAFDEIKKISISDLRNIPIKATKNYNQEPAETPEDSERLGDLVKILDCTGPLKENDVIIIAKGSEAGKTIILEKRK